MEKLYLVVREDLPPGLVAAQAVHASRLFVAEHTALEAAWYEASNTVALLGVPDESSLAALALCARTRGIAASLYNEPDLDGSLTAIALAPPAKKLVARLVPAFRGVPADLALCRR